MSEDFVFFIVPAGIMALGLFFLFGPPSRPSGNYTEVEATIIKHTTGNNTMDLNHPRPALSARAYVYPVYEYKINDNTYQTPGPVSITYFTKQKYKVGNKEVIRVKSDNPKRIYTRGEKKGTTMMGALLIGISIFGMIVAFL